MPIFSDTELERIMNESSEDRKYSDTVKDNAGKIKDIGAKAVGNFKKNAWITNQRQKKEGSKKITFKEDANGNIIDCVIDNEDYLEEGLGLLGKKSKKASNKIEDATRDLTAKTAVAIEKEKQDWESEPGAKVGETIGDIATGGNFVNTLGKKAGKTAGSLVDKVIRKKNHERKKLKEDAEASHVYRSPEFVQVMNEYFDITDNETRKVLLAVNEADQNKVLVSLTSKLYDNVVDRVDDIDFGEIESTKGDITKLPNFETLQGCLTNMKNLLIEFKQDTAPVDSIVECTDNIIESRDIWTKAYAVNAELPMITYNTMVLAIIEATAYLVSMCVEFVKSPSQDTMKIMIDKSALTKSKGHMLFKNIESFNEAYRKGQVEKAMMHIIDESAKKKNFTGLGIYTTIGAGAAVVGIVAVLFCIIPVIRELIFLFYYTRVRVSDFFEVQADLLQVNAYNVDNNRMDLTKEERKQISAKQMRTADKFRKISRSIAIETSSAEQKVTKDIKKETEKKYKTSDVMEELPDSASSALF